MTLYTKMSISAIASISRHAIKGQMTLNFALYNLHVLLKIQDSYTLEPDFGQKLTNGSNSPAKMGPLRDRGGKGLAPFGVAL